MTMTHTPAEGPSPPREAVWHAVDQIDQTLSDIRGLAYLATALAQTEDLAGTDAARALNVLADKIENAARDGIALAEELLGLLRTTRPPGST